MADPKKSQKPDYDLSNLGGRPKDWMQREHEKEVASNWWDDIWVPAAFIGLPILFLGAIGLIIYGLFE